MISVYIIAAIVLAIALGYVTRINTGFFAIAFAYVLGCFVLGLKPAEVIKMWPISIFFVIAMVSLFYNFALVNGTLEKLSMHILYRCRRIPYLLPFVIYLAAALIAALGAGFFSVLAFSAPIALLLCEKVGMNKLVGAVAVNCGALSGANFMTSGSGVVFRGLMENAGYAPDSFRFSALIFAASVLFSLLLITGFLLSARGGQGLKHIDDMEKPDSFDAKQKLNLRLMLAMIALVLIPPVLHLLLPHSALLTFINSKVDVGLIAVMMSLVAMFLKLAPQKEVVAKIPWETLIMICGVGMLISVAIKAGTINLLSGWVSSSIPAPLVPLAFALIGAFMSFFSSTLGVVCPALFPLVPSVAQATGIAPMLLFACIVIGAQSSAISPFSSGGSLILGSVSNEAERERIFSGLLFVTVPVSVLSAAFFCLAMTQVL